MAELSFDEGLDRLRSRTRLAIISIWAALLLSAASAAGEFLEAAAIVDLDAAEISPLSMIFGFVYVLFLLSFLISAVFVGMWIYRAHANLRAAGMDDLEYTPGWAVGWFFIPIMNLFKPFMAMRELWNASYGTSNSFGEESPATLKAWWGCCIASNILSTVSMRMSGNGEQAESFGLFMGGLGSIATALSAVFLLKIVHEIMSAQSGHLRVNYAFA